MAQTLHPSSLVSNSGFSSGTVSDVSSSDAITTDASGNGDYIHYGFNSPSGNTLVTGASSQSFTILAAKTSGSGTNDATLEVALYDNGTLVSTLGTAVLTSTTNATHSFNWDGSSVLGANVEIRITQTDGAGGSPSKRAYVALDEVYWTADSYDQIQPPIIDLKTGRNAIDFSGSTLDTTHDAESGDMTGLTVESGTPTADTGNVKNGTYSYLNEGGSTRDEFSASMPAGLVHYDGVEFWSYWQNGIPNTTIWLRLKNATGSNRWILRCEGSSGATGQFHLQDKGGTQISVLDINLSAATWYKFKIVYLATTSTDGEWHMEIWDSTESTLLYYWSVEGGDFSDTQTSSDIYFMSAGSTGVDNNIDDIKIYSDAESALPSTTVEFGNPSLAAGGGDVDRTVSANAESATATANAATVTADIDRDVSASTESATATANAATVDLGADLEVSATLATATATANAATVDTSADLEISATLEAASATTSAAAVAADVDRDISAGLESASAATQSATVAADTDRDVSAALETSTATAQPAAISTDRDVSAATEVGTASTLTATVTADADREVSAAVESSTAATHAANVIREEDLELSANAASATATAQAGTVDTSADRDVTSSTESATATAQAATVETSLDRDISASLVSATATTQASAVSTDREISSALESATAAAQAATVDAQADRTVSATAAQAQATAAAATVTADIDRDVTASAEQASATTYTASVDTAADRTVLGATESLSAGTSSATITRDRGVSCISASASAAAHQATIEADVDRVVLASAESVTATGQPATVDANSDRIVTATLAASQSVTYQAGITRDRLVGSQIASAGVSPLTATLSRDRGVNALRRALRSSQGISEVLKGSFSDAPPIRTFRATGAGTFVTEAPGREFAATPTETNTATSYRSFVANPEEHFNA